MIRRATASDIEVMISLLNQLFLIEADFEFHPQKQRAGLELMLKQPQHLLLVAETGKTIVGMCSVQRLISTAEGGEVGLLEDLVVDEENRGKGVGSALLQAVTEWARENGLTRLQLLADKKNGPALAFYHHKGWEETQLQGWRFTP